MPWVEEEEQEQKQVPTGRWIEEGSEEDPRTEVARRVSTKMGEGLPGEQLITTPEKTPAAQFTDRLTSYIKNIFVDPEKEKAKNANIVAMADKLKVPFNYAEGYYNTLKESQFESTDVNMQKAVKGVGIYAGAAALPFIAHGLWTAPLLTLGGLGFAEGVNEAISVTNHVMKGKWAKYKPLAGAANAEDTEYGKDVMNLISMVGGLVGMAGGAKLIPKGKSVPELASLVTKRIVQEGGIPKKVWIDGEQVAEIISGRPNILFKGGEKGSNWVPEEVIEFYKECGLSGAEARQAIKYGIDIEVSTDTIMKMVDRPYWERLKSIIKMDPYQRVISTEKGGKVTYRIGDETGTVHKPKAPKTVAIGEVAGPDAERAMADTGAQDGVNGTVTPRAQTAEGAIDAAPPAPAKAGGQAENAAGTPPKLTLAIRDGNRIFVAEKERIHGDLLTRLVEDGKIEKAHAWEDLADSKSAMGWVDEEGNFYSKDEATRMMNGEAVKVGEPKPKSSSLITDEFRNKMGQDTEEGTPTTIPLPEVVNSSAELKEAFPDSFFHITFDKGDKKLDRIIKKGLTAKPKVGISKNWGKGGAVARGVYTFMDSYKEGIEGYLEYFDGRLSEEDTPYVLVLDKNKMSTPLADEDEVMMQWDGKWQMADDVAADYPEAAEELERRLEEIKTKKGGKKASKLEALTVVDQIIEEFDIRPNLSFGYHQGGTGPTGRHLQDVPPDAIQAIYKIDYEKTGWELVYSKDIGKVKVSSETKEMRQMEARLYDLKSYKEHAEKSIEHENKYPSKNSEKSIKWSEDSIEKYTKEINEIEAKLRPKPEETPRSIEDIEAELDRNYERFMEDAGKIDIYDFVANKLESEGVSLGELYDAAKGIKGILDNLGAARKGFDKLIREQDKAVKLGKKVEERGELLAQKKAYDDALRIHKRIKTRIKEITGQQKVGNVVGEQEALNAAFKKAEQASKVAFREGNKEGAIRGRAKAKEIEAMRKNREWLKNDIKRKIHSMKVMAGRKGIDADYRELIQSMMADYDLMIRSEKTLGSRQSTRDFIEREKALGNVIDIPEKVMDMAYRKPVAEMTIDELYDLHDAVITLGKLGKLKSELIAGVKARKFANVKWQIIEEVESKLGVPTVEDGPLISTRETAWEKSIHRVRQISSEMVKIEYLVEKADNWKKDGPLYSNMFKPIVDGGLKKFKLEHATAERMKPVFDLLKDEWKEVMDGKIDIGEMGKPMVVTRENAIMISLNSGNEGNIRDLMDGNRLTRENIKNAWDRLKPEEQQFVMEVWDVVDSFFQRLQKVVRDLTGNKMERVDGHYFPIITDAELSAQAKVRMADEDMFEITMLRAKVKNGMTVRRKPNAVAGPLNLTFDVIFRHLNDVINYISYAIPIRDAQKIVLDPEISGALIKRLGKENYDQFLPWIRDIANPRNPITGGEQILATLKNNAAVAMMGWSLSVSFLQPLAYTQTINRVGWGDAISGLQDFYRNPIDNVKFILENDVWMYERTKTLDRDLREFLQSKDMRDMFTDHSIRDSFFSVMTATDRLATFPTWWTGYQIEMRKSGDHEMAVEMGRKLVRETQGSGMTADTPHIMRRQSLKIFTMFQSFFSSTYNEAWKDWQRMKDGDISRGKLIESWWWLFIVPGAISSILYNYLKKGKIDGWDAANGTLGYAAGSVPIAGSVVNSILEGWEYRPSPIVKLPTEVTKMTQAKTPRQAIEHGINAAGFVLGLPARQTLLTADFVNELTKGNMEPGRLLYKPEKKKGKKSGYNY